MESLYKVPHSMPSVDSLHSVIIAGTTQEDSTEYTDMDNASTRVFRRREAVLAIVQLYFMNWHDGCP